MWNHYEYQQLLQRILLGSQVGGSWIVSLCRDNASASPGQVKGSVLLLDNPGAGNRGRLKEQLFPQSTQPTLGQKGIGFLWQRGTWKCPGIGSLCQVSQPTIPKARHRRCLWSALFPARLLQCRGTFSDPLESCQLQ